MMKAANPPIVYLAHQGEPPPGDPAIRAITRAVMLAERWQSFDERTQAAERDAAERPWRRAERAVLVTGATTLDGVLAKIEWFFADDLRLAEREGADPEARLISGLIADLKRLGARSLPLLQTGGDPRPPAGA